MHPMPSPLLAELLAPNLHVALIHYPLGMLVVGVLIELFAFLWPQSTVRTAGRWLILIGTLSAIPAVFSGIYALRQVARVDLAVQGRSWADVKAASPVLHDPVIWHELMTHTLYQSISTAVAVLAVIVWLGCGDGARRSLRWPVLVLLLGSVGGMMVGAWWSGEAIYKHGTGVDHGWPQTEADTSMPAFSRFENWFPPVELHIIAAGVTVALSLAAVGLSFRKLALLTADPTLPAEPDGYGSGDVARSFNPNLEVTRPTVVPASRGWVVALLIAVVTATGGWFVLARSAGTLDTAKGHYQDVPKLLWAQVKPDPPQKVNRRLAHVAGSATLILLPIIFAVAAKWGPRGRVLVSVLTGLLVVVVAAQVWIGVLMLYDGPDGPINHFNTPSAEAAPGATTNPSGLSA